MPCSPRSALLALAGLALVACAPEPAPGPMRFALRGRWPGLAASAPLTWRHERADAPLPTDVVEDALQAALDEWQATGLVAFRQAPRGEDADLTFGWRRGHHGAPCLPFGVDTSIAHTGPVGPGTFVHFDLERPWWVGGGSGNDLRGTALHEIGHALGLDHTPDEAAVMYPEPGPGRGHLGRSDLAGLRTLYAAPTDPVLEPGSLRVFAAGAAQPCAVLRGVAPAGSTAWTVFDLDGDGADEVVLWRTAGEGDLWAFHFDAQALPRRTTGPILGLAGHAAQLRFGREPDGPGLVVITFGERRNAVVLDARGRPARPREEPPPETLLEPFPRTEGDLTGAGGRERVGP